ncbi:hypothetical protein [uncultured Lacinutrix sp.]|uniref:hypothetical protein n=1 Tax=uncultured Lacinutrix sp. TaxID=574032 RepID=UPI00263362DF|nr:hypothetical protein [uncultured Lacinutrix sp.]
MTNKLITVQVSKILTLCFLVFGFISKSYSQDVKNKELDSLAVKMFKTINDKDYNSILEMTHPKVFDIVPKETMATVLKSTFEGNEEFSIDMPKEIPQYKISSVYKDIDNNSDYAFLSYDLKMTMSFNNQEFDEESKEMMKNMMLMKGMEAEFISNNTLKVLMLNRLTILVKDKATNNKWVMVNYDPDSPLFFKILSVNIIEKAKEYNQGLMIESKKEQKN